MFQNGQEILISDIGSVINFDVTDMYL